LTTSAPTIAFDYRPSRWLLAALVVVGFLALLALIFCNAPQWLKLSLAIVVLVYLGGSWQRLLQPKWTSLVWHAQGYWRLHAGSDDPHIAELIGSTRIGWLLVLRFRLHGRQRFDAVLLPDNLDADTRRRLCVRLARALPDNAPGDRSS
jgi:toxin CptA